MRQGRRSLPAPKPQSRLPQDALPARLESLLEALTDRHLADRMERVHRAATVAIDRLGHLSIAKYEPTSVEADGGADLSLWETMAPAIGDTLVGVNQLVSVVHQEFPPPSRPAGLGDGGWAPPPASSDERLAQEVEAVLHAIADRLARRVAGLGQQMCRPEVVTDRWTLMAELQAFRADFRVRIGDLVYLTASAFADVRREEVVPGYAHQVGSRGAERVLAEAVEAAGARQGRSAPFDAFLRKARQEAGDGLEEAGARELLGRFRERLAALPFR